MQHSTQNKDDEAVSLAGVSASSPARRGSNSHKGTMKTFGCLDVSGESLFFGIESSKMPPVAAGLDTSAPFSVDFPDAFLGSGDDGCRQSVHAVLGCSSFPKVERPVVEKVGVGMVDDAELIQPYPLRQGVDGSMNINMPVADSDTKAAVSMDRPDSLPRELGVPRSRSRLGKEVTGRPFLPTKDARLFIERETLSQEFEGEHAVAFANTVILSFQADRRRYLGLEDASDPVEGFESIGSLAVRIVGQFELPRIVCRSMAWEEGTPTGTEEDH